MDSKLAGEPRDKASGGQGAAAGRLLKVLTFVLEAEQGNGARGVCAPAASLKCAK